MVKWLVSLPFLWQAWTGDLSVVRRKSLRVDCKVENFLPLVPRTGRQGFELAWEPSISACGNAGFCSLRLTVKIFSSWCVGGRLRLREAAAFLA